VTGIPHELLRSLAVELAELSSRLATLFLRQCRKLSTHLLDRGHKKAAVDWNDSGLEKLKLNDHPVSLEQ
jgi:hypothetical protein